MNDFNRVNQRYSLTSVDAIVAGVVCPVQNVSATGILIANWNNPPPEGTTGSFAVRTPMGDKVSSIEITGIVVRIQDDGAVALKFETPGQDWPKLLEFLDAKERAGEGEGD
ncbi:MAG: PilZ domain-containing protein [Rhodospirillales bacterium]|nr:PilZ domain-containing protein [Rhodospirillales bacterium]